MPTGPLDAGAAYRLVRLRVDAATCGLDQAAGDRIVPSCPAWTVRQTLSHLVGVCSDVLAGRADGTGAPAWTAAQVAARSLRTIGDLLAEWSVTGEQVIDKLAGRSALGQVVMDAVTHEYDLRAALALAPHPDDPVLLVAMDWTAPRFGRYLDGVGAAPLLVDTGERQWLLGSGSPAATLHAGLLDTLRSLTGRRSIDQVRALRWDGDPAPWLPTLAWGPFAPPSGPVELPVG
jgi:uncharacterized protein (TIGR03083 family)